MEEIDALKKAIYALVSNSVAVEGEEKEYCKTVYRVLKSTKEIQDTPNASAGALLGALISFEKRSDPVLGFKMDEFLQAARVVTLAIKEANYGDAP